MTLVMAYCILLSAAVAAVATIGDHVLRSRRIASRGLWLVALTLVIPVTAFVMLVPRSNESVGGMQLEIPVAEMGGVVAGKMSAPSVDWLTLADASLTVVWMASSALLFAAIALGRWRVAREKRRARRGQVLGHDVLLTDDLGPAVAGVRQPVVFVPSWVVALDHSSQRLLLAHEVEHVRRRDTGLLMVGAAVTALLPWNPVAWWLVRRLRIAVELDCDARVLETHPDVRRYADLLLVAAGKPKFMSRFLAAHFGEHMSDLERRIDAMTNTNLRRRSLGAATAAAAGLLMLACEAPRPEPLAPGKAAQATPVKQFNPEGTRYLESQVEKPAALVANSPTPKYPEILRQAGVEGDALVSFVVDEAGVADPASFKVIKASHELFATAVRQALPAMRFAAAEVGGKKVKQVVQAPFTFAIAGNKVLSSSNATLITGVGGQKQPQFTVRRADALAEEPDVVVYAFDGRELARSERDANLLKKIEPNTIHSIEVFKPRSCPTTMTCPLIKITLARGQTLGSPQRIRSAREETPAGSWEPKAETRLDSRQRIAAIMSEPHTVELLSSSGEVVARYGSRGEVREIISEDISASEHYSGKGCKVGSACPLTRIWLKPGRDAGYRKK